MEKIDVAVTQDLDPSHAADAVSCAAEALGMYVASETRLAAFGHARHWHLRRHGRTGTLEVTLTEEPLRLWVSYHTNRVGDGWVPETAPQLAAVLMRECS